jgi:hypothetical protein
LIAKNVAGIYSPAYSGGNAFVYLLQRWLSLVVSLIFGLQFPERKIEAGYLSIAYIILSIKGRQITPYFAIFYVTCGDFRGVSGCGISFQIIHHETFFLRVH